MGLLIMDTDWNPEKPSLREAPGTSLQIGRPSIWDCSNLTAHLKPVHPHILPIGGPTPAKSGSTPEDSCQHRRVKNFVLRPESLLQQTMPLAATQLLQ